MAAILAILLPFVLGAGILAAVFYSRRGKLPNPEELSSPIKTLILLIFSGTGLFLAGFVIVLILALIGYFS